MERCEDFSVKPQKNQIIVNPEKSKLIQSAVAFEGVGNILFVEDGVYVHNSKITFFGNHSVIYLSKNYYKYFLNLSVFCDDCVYIGTDNYFNGPINILAGEHQNIILGNDSLFSFTITLKTVDGHLLIDGRTRKRINDSRSIYIGDHVWVGQQAVLLKGTWGGLARWWAPVR